MKNILAWNYMIEVLASISYPAESSAELELAYERAKNVAFNCAESVGAISNTPRIHLAAKAK